MSLFHVLFGEIWLSGNIGALVSTPVLVINFVISDTVFLMFPEMICGRLKLVRGGGLLDK